MKTFQQWLMEVAGNGGLAPPKQYPMAAPGGKNAMPHAYGPDEDGQPNPELPPGTKEQFFMKKMKKKMKKMKK